MHDVRRLKRCTVQGHPAALAYVADMARALFVLLESDLEVLLDFLAAKEGCADADATQFLTKPLLRRHVRRIVPLPDVLLPRVAAVQAFYSAVKDERGFPLFTEGARLMWPALPSAL